jgi:hypothetical protein
MNGVFWFPQETKTLKNTADGFRRKLYLYYTMKFDTLQHGAANKINILVKCVALWYNEANGEGDFTS